MRWDISDGINLFLQYKKLTGYFAALSEVFECQTMQEKQTVTHIYVLQLAQTHSVHVWL